MSKEFSKLHIRKMPIAQYPRYTQTTSTSNRTSLELKLACIRRLYATPITSNRTSLELKQPCYPDF